MFIEPEFASPMFRASKFNVVGVTKFLVMFLIRFQGLRSSGGHCGKISMAGTTIFNTAEACGNTTEEEKNHGDKRDPESYKCS